jgi:hypothetical protein
MMNYVCMVGELSVFLPPPYALLLPCFGLLNQFGFQIPPSLFHNFRVTLLTPGLVYPLPRAIFPLAFSIVAADIPLLIRY